MGRSIFVTMVALIAVVLAGAAGEGPSPLNRAVAAFARAQLGKAVGNGECTTLAVEALRSAGARRPPRDPRGDGDFVWGRPVGLFRDAQPGDVVQFRDAVFQGKQYVSKRRWITWRQSYVHHTAIIGAVREDGRVIILLHQNVGDDGASEAAKRIVTETTLRPESLQKGGKVSIYRPTPLSDPLPDGQ